MLLSQYVLLAATLLAGTAAPVQSDDTSDQPRGTWVHHAKGHKVSLQLDAHTLRCSITDGGGYTLVVDADYLVTRDGFLVGVIRTRKSAEGKTEDQLAKRFFSCRVMTEKNSLILNDVSWAEDKQTSKEVLEGKYKLVKEAPHCCGASPVTRSSMKKKAQDSSQRLIEQMKQSEDLRQNDYEWERIWFNDEPSHLTPERVRGSIR
jgi:hypothetical protein